jgi:endonuclease YncB( thermonuclease family)
MKLLHVARIIARIVLALAGVGLAGGVAVRSFYGTPAAPAWEAGRVTRVVDADTYDVLCSGGKYRVRLLGVDAPELSQPFGKQAADSVAKLLTAGRAVQLQRRSTDMYGRALGCVRLAGPTVLGKTSGVALDSLLVVRGWAWADAPSSATLARQHQQDVARVAGRGLWRCGTKGAVPPKTWRGFNAENKRRYWVGCAW